MATSQAFLDGLRAQAGFGMNYTRPSRTRSADQNNTISGNPGYSSNMTPSWQQMVMNSQNNAALLAQNPTNINYIQPNPTQQLQTYAQQMQANNGAGPTPQQLAAQRNTQLDPRGAPTPQQIALMQAQARQTAGNQLPMNGQPNNFAQQFMNYNGGGTMPNVNFVQPRALNPVQQMMGMGQGGRAVQPRGYTPNQLAAGPSGSRFVRPMMR